MIYEVLDPVLKQIEVLHRLSKHRADATWSHNAIRKCTREIEALTAGNTCAYYARNIRIALDQVVKGESSGRTCLSETIVGGRIDLLVDYVDRVRRSSEEMMLETA